MLRNIFLKKKIVDKAMLESLISMKSTEMRNNETLQKPIRLLHFDDKS